MEIWRLFTGLEFFNINFLYVLLVFLIVQCPSYILIYVCNVLFYDRWFNGTHAGRSVLWQIQPRSVKLGQDWITRCNCELELCFFFSLIISRIFEVYLQHKPRFALYHQHVSMVICKTFDFAVWRDVSATCLCLVVSLEKKSKNFMKVLSISLQLCLENIQTSD